MFNLPTPLELLQHQIDHYSKRLLEATGKAKWHCRKELFNLKKLYNECN